MSNDDVEYLGTKKKSFLNDDDVEFLSSSMSPSTIEKTYAEYLEKPLSPVTDDERVPIEQEGANKDFHLYEDPDLNQPASAQGPSVEETVIDHRPPALARAAALLQARFGLPPEHEAAQSYMGNQERWKAQRARTRAECEIIRHKAHRTEDEEALLRSEEKRLEKARDKAKQQRDKKKAEKEQTAAVLEGLKREVKALREWKEDHLDLAEARRERILELEAKVEYWERRALGVENQE